MLTLKEYQSKHFWKQTVPFLSVGALTELDDKQQIRPPEAMMEEQKTKLDVDGYFTFPSVIDEGNITKLQEGALTLKKNGLSALFLGLYDEFWQMVGNLRPVGQYLLGEDYMIFPDYWVWYVDGSPSNEGWSPHRDEIVDSNDPNYPVSSISLWVSLSDATAENGCMFVLPKSKDKGYPSQLVFNIDTLQDLRALPVPKGSIIGWDQSLFHWGGKSSQWSNEPRISFAIELRHVSKEDGIPDMLESNRVPSFEERLRLIAMQFDNFKHLHSETSALMRLCRLYLKEQGHAA